MEEDLSLLCAMLDEYVGGSAQAGSPALALPTHGFESAQGGYGHAHDPDEVALLLL